MTEQRIYFMQHGLAVDKTVDSERPLSDAGTRETQIMAEALRSSDAPLSRIFHSGKLRAQQTAEIVASAMDISTIEVANGLSPNDDVKMLAAELSNDDALYVGHLPHLEKLVSLLTSGHENPAVLHFKNSAIVYLEKDKTPDQAAPWRIHWYLTPNSPGIAK